MALVIPITMEDGLTANYHMVKKVIPGADGGSAIVLNSYMNEDTRRSDGLPKRTKPYVRTFFAEDIRTKEDAYRWLKANVRDLKEAEDT